jgi:hypothetical protein
LGSRGRARGRASNAAAGGLGSAKLRQGTGFDGTARRAQDDLARRFLTRHQQLPPGAGHAAIIVQDAEIDLDGAKAAAADHHRFLGAGGGS